MRKYIPLALAAFVLLSCQKETLPSPQPEQPITKTVTFQVFAAKNYSDKIFANTIVEVKLGVNIVDLLTGKNLSVWDTTFTRRNLSLFPQHAEMYVVEKSMPVYERTQMLQAGYGIRYDTDGMVSQEGLGDGLSQGENNLRVEVSL